MANTERNVFDEYFERFLEEEFSNLSTITSLASPQPTFFPPPQNLTPIDLIPASPQPDFHNNNVDISGLGLDDIPTPPLYIHEFGLPPGVANTLGLARLQGAFTEFDIHNIAAHPPAPDMFSDMVKADARLDPGTQEQMMEEPIASGPASGTASAESAPSSSNTTTATPIKPTIITLISKIELERIRQHNCILRSNNISIFTQRNQMEGRALAAEERVRQLEQQIAMERDGRLRAEEVIRHGDGVVARLQLELGEARREVNGV